MTGAWWSEHALDRLRQRVPGITPGQFMDELIRVTGYWEVLVRGRYRAEGWAVHPATGARAVLRTSSDGQTVIVTVFSPHRGLARLFTRMAGAKEMAS